MRSSDGIHISEEGGQYAADRLQKLVAELGSAHRATEAQNTVANQAQAPWAHKDNASLIMEYA